MDVAIGERLVAKTFRQYIKSWITRWDIERLYSEQPAIEAHTIPTDYTENTELEQFVPGAGVDDE